MSIEELVRGLVEGFKEMQRLELKMNHAENRKQQDEVKKAVKANEEKVLESGVQLAVMVLTDLHRIAAAQETRAKPRSMI